MGIGAGKFEERLSDLVSDARLVGMSNNNSDYVAPATLDAAWRLEVAARCAFEHGHHYRCRHLLEAAYEAHWGLSPVLESEAEYLTRMVLLFHECRRPAVL